MDDLLGLLKSSLEVSSSALNKDSEQVDPAELQKRRTEIVMEYRQLEPSFAFLPLDFSIGCWGPEAVGTFREPIRHLVAAILTLLEFHKSRIESRLRIDELMQLDDEDRPEKTRRVGVHHRSQVADMIKGLSTEEQSINKNVAGNLTARSKEAMETCLEGLDVAGACLKFVSSQYWYLKTPKGKHQELSERIEKALEKLRISRPVFLHEMTETVLSAYEPALQRDERRAHQMAGIVTCMNFQEHMANALEKTEAVLTCTSNVFPDASRTRFWWPTSFKYAGKWFTKKKAPVTTTSDDTDSPDATQDAQEKLRVRRGYRPRTRHPIGKALLGTYHWLTSDEGLYALRMVVVTIAVSIPAVLPNTAGFFYREKGFWGLIMAQTGLLVYMADFTFSIIARLAGTVGGGVLGMLAWYIGSGHGPGNPYGLSAVMAVMLVIFLWIRLYLPPNLLQGGIIAAATFLLTVAYSYVDT